MKTSPAGLAFIESWEALFLVAYDVAAADLVSKQEPLEAEFEKVLFDNLWELYAR